MEWRLKRKTRANRLKETLQMTRLKVKGEGVRQKEVIGGGKSGDKELRISFGGREGPPPLPFWGGGGTRLSRSRKGEIRTKSEEGLFERIKVGDIKRICEKERW